MNAAVGQMSWHRATCRIALGLTLAAALAFQPAARAESLKIVIEIDGKPVAATLVDSPVARDFASMLPLTLNLNDYGNIEKAAELPRKLSLRDAPPGVDPDIGDIGYFVPSGKVRIFYKDLGYLDGLVKLGSIDSSIAPLKAPGPMKVVIKKADAAR